MSTDTTKYQITITVSKDILNWIDEEIKEKRRFANRSHAFELCAMYTKTNS